MNSPNVMNFQSGDIVILSPEEGFFPKRELKVEVRDVRTGEGRPSVFIVSVVGTCEDLEPGSTIALSPRFPSIPESLAMNFHVVVGADSNTVFDDRNTYGWVTVRISGQ